MSIADFLNKTCTIKRSTPSKSTTMGNTKYTYSDAATGVPCCVQTRKAWQQFEPAQAGVTEYDVYFEYFTPDSSVTAQPKNTDRLVSITGLANMSLALASDPIDDSGEGAYIRFIARQVTGEAGV